MMTLQKAIDLFLTQYKPSTRKSYNLVLKQFVQYTGGARPLEKLSSPHIMEFMESVDNRPAVTSEQTYNRYLKTLRTFFNWCVKVDYLDKSPVVGLKLRRITGPIPRDKAMPDKLYEKLVKHTAAYEIIRGNPRGYALVLFLGDTGCRVSGAAGLTWDDVDLIARSASVTEKGHTARLVYYGFECAQVLQRWHEYQTRDGGQYTFSNDGKRIQNDNLGQFFRRLCQTAGIGSWGPHSLRHRLGWRINDNRISPAVGAATLGNSVEVFLSYYSPRDEERIKATVDELAYSSKEKPAKVTKFRKQGSA